MNPLFGFAPSHSPQYPNILEPQQRTASPDLSQTSQIAALGIHLYDMQAQLDMMAQQIAQLSKMMPTPLRHNPRQPRPRILPPFEVAAS